MSNIIRKLDNALHPEERQPTQATTAAPAGAMNAGHHHPHHLQQQQPINPAANPAAAEGGYQAGPHRSALANKLDPNVDSNPNSIVGGAGAHQQAAPTYGGTQPATHGAAVPAAGGMNLPGPAPHTAGPHRSDLLNELDPRVDAHPRGAGAGAGAGVAAGAAAGAHHHHQHHHGHGDGGVAAGGAGMQPVAQQGQLPGPAPATAGPHRSDALNKLDPRVDADLSGHGHGAGAGAGTGMAVGAGAGAATAAGVHHHHNHHHHDDGRVGASGAGTLQKPAPQGNFSGPAPTTGGPHRSALLNKLDPNVDSTGLGGAGAGRHGAGAGTEMGGGVGGGTVPGQGAGFAGTGPAPNTAGPHRHDALNKMDPRVDSVYTGPAPNTAGPHRHDFMNKLDPAVDSNPGMSDARY